MKIESTKDLARLISLCRKTGIESLKIDNIEFKLSPYTPTIKTQPRRSSINTSQVSGIVTEDTKILSPDELTPEQLLFYSADGREQ